MIPTMWLIVEGKSDVKIIQRILDEKKIAIKVEQVKPKFKGGLPRLAQELEELIKSAMLKRKSGDCIVVLHDADALRPILPEHRKHYSNIEKICTKYKDHVTRIVARDEIEAWLLADEGLCKWLGISPQTDCDSIEKPSHKLNRYLEQHKKMKWNGYYWDSILKNMDATGDNPNRSPSMKQALNRLRKLPCTQMKTP